MQVCLSVWFQNEKFLSISPQCNVRVLCELKIFTVCQYSILQKSTISTGLIKKRINFIRRVRVFLLWMELRCDTLQRNRRRNCFATLSFMAQGRSSGDYGATHYNDCNFPLPSNVGVVHCCTLGILDAGLFDCRAQEEPNIRKILKTYFSLCVAKVFFFGKPINFWVSQHCKFRRKNPTTHLSSWVSFLLLLLDEFSFMFLSGCLLWKCLCHSPFLDLDRKLMLPENTPFDIQRRAFSSDVICYRYCGNRKNSFHFAAPQNYCFGTGTPV